MLKRLYLISSYNVKRVLLLLFIAGAFFWFGGKAIFELWTYYSLGKYAPASVQEWTIEEIGSRCFVTAHYTFELQGKTYQGATRFKDPVFLNRFSAEEGVKKWRELSWYAWYNLQKPEKSSMQKLFPYKSCVYAAIILGVFLYLQALSRKILKQAR